MRVFVDIDDLDLGAFWRFRIRHNVVGNRLILSDELGCIRIIQMTRFQTMSAGKHVYSLSFSSTRLVSDEMSYETVNIRPIIGSVPPIAALTVQINCIAH